MKLTAKVKLNTDNDQYQALKETLERANDACNRISDIAWEDKTFRQFNLHKLVYTTIREQTRLTAQVVVRAIAKVADAYKLDRKTKRTFKPHAAFPYDDRILRWYTDRQSVSIWTVNGRIHVPFSAGGRQLAYLAFRQGESDLVFYKGEFYLFATCDIPDPSEKDVEGILGVDLGIVNLATSSDGDIYSGKQVEKTRSRYGRLRASCKARARSRLAAS